MSVVTSTESHNKEKPSLYWRAYVMRNRLCNRFPFLWRILNGIGFANSGHADWRWASTLRMFLSRYLLIGNWFGGRECCRVCGIDAIDADYAFKRIGFNRARCADGYDCGAEMPD